MSTKKKRIIWSGIAVVSIATSLLNFAATHYDRAVASTEKRVTQAPLTKNSVTRLTNNSIAIASASPQITQATGPVQMVRFTVYDQGIIPAVAHSSPGLVSIYLDDKSTHTASLILADEQHALGSINRGQGRSRGRSTIVLTAGRYTIYEADRRSNKATLIVAP
jgi:hypothetical protein